MWGCYLKRSFRFFWRAYSCNEVFNDIMYQKSGAPEKNQIKKSKNKKYLGDTKVPLATEIPLQFPIENQWILMTIHDFWWKSMVLGQFWRHFWAKVHKIINHWNERCTVVVWVLYTTWIISECSGPSNMVIPSSWHLISCPTAQIPLGARHPTVVKLS